MEDFEKVFFYKQSKLIKAMERQKKLYDFYVVKLKGGFFEQKYNFDFNLLHDLEDRLKKRIEDLQSKYYDLHFEKYGFNAY